MDSSTLSTLRTLFGDRMQENAPLSGYTSARLGGPADALVFVHSEAELVHAAQELWKRSIPFILVGGGSNLLVGDRGVRGVVLVNRARLVRFDTQADPPTVRAESGAVLTDIAQRAARLGLSGLEWAVGIPGSLGGAVYGNAGAFGGEMAGNLVTVELLFPHGRETWPAAKMEYGYRTSLLKRGLPQPCLILAATLQMTHGDRQAIQDTMSRILERRRATQPPGASMGSIFKNPPGDKAGRLLEAAGLKGTRIGGAEISSQHANFFINSERARAEDMKALIELAQRVVFEKFGVKLEPEIELIGEW